MNKLLQAVAAKTYQLCRTYPGGIRAMFAGMREQHGLSESSVYADLNPNNGQSTLRVWELVRVMEATGEHGPLRELANWFGYSLASAADEEPDAPTLEAEALQDYPPLVAFHEGCKLYRQGKITLAQLDELKDRAFKEVRETFCRDGQGGRMNLTFSAHALDRCFERASPFSLSQMPFFGTLGTLRRPLCRGSWTAQSRSGKVGRRLRRCDGLPRRRNQ